ncbi:MAG: hypothetical protein ACT4O5_14135 [Gammaproteobacteria bacterium]
MNAGLGRRRRFALGGVTLALAAWAGAPWVFCSETWARPAESQCTGEPSPASGAKPRSLRESAPPLAPFFV